MMLEEFSLIASGSIVSFQSSQDMIRGLSFEAKQGGPHQRKIRDCERMCRNALRPSFGQALRVDDLVLDDTIVNRGESMEAFCVSDCQFLCFRGVKTRLSKKICGSVLASCPTDAAEIIDGVVSVQLKHAFYLFPRGIFRGEQNGPTRNDVDFFRIPAIPTVVVEIVSVDIGIDAIRKLCSREFFIRSQIAIAPVSFLCRLGHFAGGVLCEVIRGFEFGKSLPRRAQRFVVQVEGGELTSQEHRLISRSTREERQLRQNVEWIASEVAKLDVEIQPGPERILRVLEQIVEYVSTEGSPIEAPGILSLLPLFHHFIVFCGTAVPSIFRRTHEVRMTPFPLIIIHTVDLDVSTPGNVDARFLEVHAVLIFGH